MNVVKGSLIKNVSDIEGKWSVISDGKLVDGENNNFFILDKHKKYLSILSIDDSKSIKRFIFVPFKLVNNKKFINILNSYKKYDPLIGVLPYNGEDVMLSLVEEWSKKQNKKEQEINKSDLILKAERLFEISARKGASDLHIESREDELNIRIRVNGRIVPFDNDLSPSAGDSLGSVIYSVLTKSSDVTFKPRITQDALVETEINGETFRARLATAPAYPNGFDMVLRLLKIESPDEPLSLEQMGYTKKLSFSIKKGLAKNIGLVIISGTTGSGKSTTLQHIALDKIKARNGEIKMITVEDPVEYLIQGATQIPVIATQDKESAKKQYEDAMKAAMRLDPDILTIGEVRDEQTAQSLVKAVQSGHKVLSTVHASSSYAIIGRLNNFGIPRDILGGPEFISSLIYQKLMPRVCDSCGKKLKGDVAPEYISYNKLLIDKKIIDTQKLDIVKKDMSRRRDASVNVVRYLQDAKMISATNADKIHSEYELYNSLNERRDLVNRIDLVCDRDISTIMFRGDGCKKCDHTGELGRTLVAEVISPDTKGLEYILENKDSEFIAHWRKNMGGKFVIENAYDKMKEGILSPISIENELNLIGSKLIV
jgi:type II secretory ATPase GspE/PulE/Tfp pilus assembly ATPase PilB-like protein